MEWIKSVYNPVFVAAFMSWLIAQVIKMITYLVKNKEISVERFWGAGGMPSSHAAAVCALASAIAVIEGANSNMFAIAALLALVVMYDASGVRRAAGMHAKEINNIKTIIDQFHEDMRKPGAKNFEETKAQLKELLGHSPIEVFFGALLGIAVGIFFTII